MPHYLATESTKEAAKRIRGVLKEKFPHECFSVRISRGSLDSSIDIKWRDGVALEKVEPHLRRFENVRTDEVSGETLGGGNRFIFARRDVSEHHVKQIEDEIWNRFTKGTFYSRDDPRFRDLVWREGRRRDLPSTCEPRRSRRR